MEELSHEFDIKTLCEVAGVSRSGFCKWRERDGAPPERRTSALKTVSECHEAHSSHGCRWAHARLGQEGKTDVSAGYVRRTFDYLGMRSETKRRAEKCERRLRGPKRGPHANFGAAAGGQPRSAPIGGAHTSTAYNEIVEEAGIARSCSRAGKLADNPVSESLNGWIKEEPFCGFHLGNARGSNEVARVIGEYVDRRNAERPCRPLGCKAPDALYGDCMAGRTERKGTFSKRVLDETPGFLREKPAKAEDAAEGSMNGMGSSDALLFG